MNSMDGPDPHTVPIFVLGIMQRSGTGYLYNLLRLHPACRAGGVIWEDGLVAHADLLVTYAETVYENWPADWRVKEIMGPPDVLCARLGEGLISFLNSQTTTQERDRGEPTDHAEEGSSERLVTKTPSVENLALFFRLFPRAHLLIIVRDGRAVVESGVRSFSWRYESAMHSWAAAARTIRQFDSGTDRSRHRCLIVRYEDLFRSTEDEMRKVFSFLGLNAGIYDFGAAAKLPVRGSSESRERGQGDVHWGAEEQGPDFDPTRRWSDWGRGLHERFNWIAGDLLERFGYQQRTYTGNRLFWAAWNVVLDAKWGLKRAMRRGVKRVLRVVR